LAISGARLHPPHFDGPLRGPPPGEGSGGLHMGRPPPGGGGAGRRIGRQAGGETAAATAPSPGTPGEPASEPLMPPRPVPNRSQILLGTGRGGPSAGSGGTGAGTAEPKERSVGSERRRTPASGRAADPGSGHGRAAAGDQPAEPAMGG